MSERFPTRRLPDVMGLVRPIAVMSTADCLDAVQGRARLTIVSRTARRLDYGPNNRKTG